jgi:hypothetical protein
MPTDTRLDISTLPVARTPPKICPAWEWSCWVFFVLGALLVLASLVLIGFAGPGYASWARWPVASVMCVGFFLAACNTLVAAKGFGTREKALRKWLDSHLKWIGETIQANQTLASPSDQNPDELKVRRDPVPNLLLERGPITVEARGDFQPNPYRYGGKDSYIQCSLKTYVDFIRAEVHDARVKAGSLAAALGGLTLTSIQIYARILAATSPQSPLHYGF